MLSRLALLGAKKGPCVSGRGIKNAYLKVTGLPDGEGIVVVTDQGIIPTIGSNGLHKLGGPYEWFQVNCSVSNRNIVCEVVSIKAA